MRKCDDQIAIGDAADATRMKEPGHANAIDE